MKTQALRYYMHDGPAAFRFELAGDLNDEGARRLEQDWSTASSVIGDRLLIVDLTFVPALRRKHASCLPVGMRRERGSSPTRMLRVRSRGRSWARLFQSLRQAWALSPSHRSWFPFHASLLDRVRRGGSQDTSQRATSGCVLRRAADHKLPVPQSEGLRGAN